MRRSTVTWSLVAGLAVTLFAPSARAEVASEEKAVLGVVQTLLDGWREADVAKLEAVLHPDFREVTLHLADGVWDFAAVDRARLIGIVSKNKKGAWDDRLLDPQVHVDGPIAVVWSRYRFTVHYTEKGEERSASHCGIETFQLYRIDTRWQIVNFADTHASCP